MAPTSSVAPSRTPTTTRTRRAPRASSAVAARNGDSEAQYDLLTAALMGMAVGAGLTYVLRRGPSGRRPISPALAGAGRGLVWAGKNAWKAGARGASWAGDRGEEMWEKVPRDEIRRSVTHGYASAKEAISASNPSSFAALASSRSERTSSFSSHNYGTSTAFAKPPARQAEDVPRPRPPERICAGRR